MHFFSFCIKSDFPSTLFVETSSSISRLRLSFRVVTVCGLAVSFIHVNIWLKVFLWWQVMFVSIITDHFLKCSVSSRITYPACFWCSKWPKSYLLFFPIWRSFLIVLVIIIKKYLQVYCICSLSVFTKGWCSPSFCPVVRGSHSVSLRLEGWNGVKPQGQGW